jgi:hypothetical protein
MGAGGGGDLAAGVGAGAARAGAGAALLAYDDRRRKDVIMLRRGKTLNIAVLNSRYWRESVSWSEDNSAFDFPMRVISNLQVLVMIFFPLLLVVDLICNW